jgi:mannan endo-1,4-beta-mannosidase
MDVYVNQIAGAGKGHDLFYTDSRIITAFKKYINAFVTRYKDEPAILAWELANEPRCRGSTGATTGTCTTATVTNWARDISAYIKSIDTNHLVALGDEGFFNQPSGPNYPYQGGEGVDFVANLAISTLDFGTVHAYPDAWGQASNAQAWGVQWIKDHAAEQVRANKPVILEEFGFPGTTRTSMYSSWYSTIESVGLAGDMIWQAGTRFSTGWSSHDDGFTIFTTDPVYALQQTHNAKMKART